MLKDVNSSFRNLEKECKIKIAAIIQSKRDKMNYGLGGFALGTMLAVSMMAAPAATGAATKVAAGGAAVEAAKEAASAAVSLANQITVALMAKHLSK